MLVHAHTLPRERRDPLSASWAGEQLHYAQLGAHSPWSGYMQLGVPWSVHALPRLNLVKLVNAWHCPTLRGPVVVEVTGVADGDLFYPCRVRYRRDHLHHPWHRLVNARAVAAAYQAHHSHRGHSFMDPQMRFLVTALDPHTHTHNRLLGQLAEDVVTSRYPHHDWLLPDSFAAEATVMQVTGMAELIRHGTDRPYDELLQAVHRRLTPTLAIADPELAQRLHSGVWRLSQLGATTPFLNTSGFDGSIPAPLPADQARLCVMTPSTITLIEGMDQLIATDVVAVFRYADGVLDSHPSHYERSDRYGVFVPIRPQHVVSDQTQLEAIADSVFRTVVASRPSRWAGAGVIELRKTFNDEATVAVCTRGRDTPEFLIHLDMAAASLGSLGIASGRYV